MYTLWLFFRWPDGWVWSNVVAMPVCAVMAALAAFVAREQIGRALRGWLGRHLGHHAELAAIRERLDAHADLLDPSTPGGMATLLADIRDAKMAAESAKAAAEALASIVARPAARRGKTEMRPTGAGKAEGS